jgi:putative sterol carrier protein
MITFIEFSQQAVVEEWLAERLQVSVLDLLDKTPWQRMMIDNWEIVATYVDSPQDLLFSEEDSSATQPLLINFQELEIDQDVIDFLDQLTDTSREVFVYSYELPKLKTDLKKKWKKAGLGYEIVTKSQIETREKVAQAYAQQLDLKLSQKNLKEVAESSLHWREVVNNLDLLWLSGSPKKALPQVVEAEATPLFKYSLRPHTLERDVRRWSEIGEGEIQLAMSLIAGKLEKQQSATDRKLLQKLILTDEKMKTRSEVEATTWWKLFLYEVKQEY